MSASLPLPPPPHPFAAASYVISPGMMLHRVHSSHRAPDVANPGLGPPTRFAPLPVPVLYAAVTARAAIAETILHDAVYRPGALNVVPPTAYLDRSLARLQVTGDLRVADLTGLEAKRLGVEGTALSAHLDDSATVRWAESAYRAGYGGVSFMSHRCNTDRAFVLFDREGELADRLDVVSSEPFLPTLTPSPAFDTLVDACTAAGFEVLC